MRALLEAGADVAQAMPMLEDCTALMAASGHGHVECVRALLEAGADVAQAQLNGWTALMGASQVGNVECVHALLEAGAEVMQLHGDGHTCALVFALESLETLQLLCAYAPSREAVHAYLTPDETSAECAQWLDATRRWTSALHHFEFLPLERVRALLVEGADVRVGDGEADAPTPLSLAAARLLLLGDGAGDGRAELIVRAAPPWSPGTHALFPAGAKARAVELLRIGWLLARHLQDASAANEVEMAFRDAWLGHVMPHAIERR